jgi:hypothetical protein
MATLLGHLATFHTFFTQGEVLCTGGLTYLLKTHLDARAALAEAIREATGVDVPADLSWTAESRQADGGRVDVEGRTSDRIPLVKIEAKLDAGLSADQLRSYAHNLGFHTQPQGLNGALVVLVPSMRAREAKNLISNAFSLDGAGPWRLSEQPTVSVAVLSWEHVFAALARVESAECRDDARQLHGLYSGTCGYHIVPPRRIEDLREWRTNEKTYVSLVDQITRRLTEGKHSVYPMAREATEDPPSGLDPKGYLRRYVCRPGGPGPCFSIGVRDPFEGPGDPTPIWLRFNAVTDHFAEIRRGIESSSLATRSVFSGGHFWFPLPVPLNLEEPQLVESLIKSAQEIVDIAYQFLPPEKATPRVSLEEEPHSGDSR